MLISLSGFISSGKDATADYLVEEYQFTRESFASTIKDVLATIFGWDRIMLEGRTKEARDSRDKTDYWWANRLNIPNFTPRWAMQNIGTNLFRTHFHDEIWIAALEHKLSQASGNIVITDARYLNELSTIKRLGGKCWQIERGKKPDWYDYAMQYNFASDDSRASMISTAFTTSEPNMFAQNIHTSEWHWVGFPFDRSIDNNGDLNKLHYTVQEIINRDLTD